MKAIIAVKNKKKKDATATAITMLKVFHENVETFGIASSNAIKIEESLEKLQNEKLSTPVIVGCAFSKIFKDDFFPLIKFKNAATAFDGRIYAEKKAKVNAEKLFKKLSSFETAKNFVKETEGDFVFASIEAEKLIVGRDALGVRPLYYGENEKCLALASERKALWTIGIKDALTFPCGHIAQIGKNGFRTTRTRTIVHSTPKQIKMEDAVKELRKLLKKSISKRVSGLKEVAVAFSGGLDSSLIATLAKNEGIDTHLIHVSLEKQLETTHAKKAAESLGLTIHIYQYKEDDVKKVIPKVLCLIEEPHALKASISIPIYWIAEKTAELGFKVLLTGQGADELFGGYERYVKKYLRFSAEHVRKLMFNDVLSLGMNNFERDFKLCNFHNVELRLPFASYIIAKFAIDLPIELKICKQNNGLRKLVLRNVAKEVGMPDFIKDRPKKAIQYATGMDRALKKIAKKEKMSLKEYLTKTFHIAMKNVKGYA